jgi:hypothetical protein
MRARLVGARLVVGLVGLAAVACAPVVEPPAAGPEGTPVDAAIVALNWPLLEACVGLAGDAPTVLWAEQAYLNAYAPTASGTTNGFYASASQTVVVPPDLRAMHHEMVHHLLDEAGVPRARNLAHDHPAFRACDWAFTVLPPGYTTPAGETFPEGRWLDGGPYPGA